MNIEYVCHACLLIDTGDVKIATDPWFAGPAYCGQWQRQQRLLVASERLASTAGVVDVEEHRAANRRALG